MDTHYRHPEDANKIIYGEWVVYRDPYKGNVLATVQNFLPKIDPLNKNPSYPDTSYVRNGNGTMKYKENFKCEILFHTKDGAHVVETYNDRIRPLTEDQERDLRIYMSRDLSQYPLIIHNPMLKAAVTKCLKENTTDVCPH